jgi:hypothetical protein
MSERRKSSGSRRAGGSRKVNRAQQKAMEVRAAETVASEQVVEAPVHLAAESSKRSPARARRRSGQVAPSKPVLLTRAQEYAFIRSDFRRLLITGGSLLAVMLVLLVVIE